MSRIRLSHHIKALQQQHDSLIAELASLQRRKRALMIRQAILGSWCEILNIFQSRAAVLSCAEDVDAEQYQTLLHEEVQLLQQLAASQRTALHQQPGMVQQQQDAGLAALMQQSDVQTIAPCTDPMAFFRSLLLKDPLEEAATMTAEQYAVMMKEAMVELSLKLHKLKHCSAWERADRLRDIRELWVRFFHYTVSLALMGRHDVVQDGFNYNFDTMETDSTAWQRQEQHAPELVSAMDLSEQQQELIAAGYRLFLDLQQVIHKEHQDLHAQIAALDDGDAGDSGGDTNAAAAAAAGGNTCCAHASSIVAGSSSSSRKKSPPDKSGLNQWGRQARLERQESLRARLQPLLFKVYRLHLTAIGWIMGCLTYEQASLATMLLWPHAWRAMFLGAEVMKRREEQQQHC